MPSFADWRAQVNKELAGASFDKLVQVTAEGLAIQPLYVEASGLGLRASGGGFGVCMRSDAAHIEADLDGGADAVWLAAADAAALSIARARGVPVLIDDEQVVSGLPFHDAGADAADELALMLSTMVAHLRAGATPSAMWFQIAVGRDTFGEVAKLRALRVLAAKVFAAAGITAELPPIHAVCSARTQSQRDPWVNMLRVTTEIFAAALGGARYVTPAPFDAALGEPSAHARRVARNTALVLRDESFLGRVADAAGGSYYIESRTDALAREAWSRFQQLERDGTGNVAERLEASWQRRAAAIGKRKEPILGVSEFANLSEQLPSPPPAAPHVGHRDAEGFEALRARVESSPPRVVLIPLGPPAEHRARTGFATALFATAGIGVTEGSTEDIACICGSDERYAAEAADKVTELRAAGTRKIVLAGRPGADGSYGGFDAYIFLGCDVLATLTELLS